jgi:hypothetical protein
MQIILFGLGIILGALLTYLTAYMKKKGENFATREDLQDLVKQMSAVTEATKKIEAEISTGVWDRQKRWELRRDVLFEAGRRLADLDEALLRYDALVRVIKAEPTDRTEMGEFAWAQSTHDVTENWRKASINFDESRLLVSIVCSRSVTSAFDDLAAFTNSIASKLTQNDVDIYKESRRELFKKILTARTAIRKELGTDDADSA